MDCIVHGITKSRTRLSDFHCHCLSRSGRDQSALVLPPCLDTGTLDPGKRALTEADRAGPREGRKRIRAVSLASDSSLVTRQDAHASPRCGPDMGP